MKKIKTFQDACKILGLDPLKVIPEFLDFPESDRKAMQAHAKLIIINKAIVGDWVPDWTNYSQYKYYPWFEMGSPSGAGFSYFACAGWSTDSDAGSRLCFETREQAKYAGTQFLELYKDYFVK